jgi:hypothetical protein
MATIWFVQDIIFILALQDYTLHETWSSIKLDVSNLKIFGYPTYVHIPIELCHKLELKLHECIFLGYGETSCDKLYKLYEKTKKKIILKINMGFNEEAMFLKEGYKTFDATIYKSIEGEDEGFMPFDVEFEEPPFSVPMNQVAGPQEISIHHFKQPQ